jgi:PadR family transcriptional regulator PadR
MLRLTLYRASGHRRGHALALTAAGWCYARPSRRKYYAIAASGRERLLLLRAEWSGLVGAVKGLLDSLDAMNHGGASSAETDAT